jgi:urea carboxylase
VDTCKYTSVQAPGPCNGELITSFRLWGLTIPGCPFDTYGTKPNFQPDRPYLFDTFDQVVFQAVTREELDEINRKFHLGLYKIDVKEYEFSLADYIATVERTSEEARTLRQRREQAAEVELNKYVYLVLGRVMAANKKLNF